MKNKLRKMNGFTLFEMLVVISIIAILTAAISLSFSSAQRKARDSRRIEDMKSIQSAAEQMYALSGYVYPAASGAWTANGQTVLAVFPKDPKSVGWTAYVYGGGTTYCACAAVEDSNNGNSSNSSCNFSAAMTGPFFCVKNQQ